MNTTEAYKEHASEKKLSGRVNYLTISPLRVNNLSISPRRDNRLLLSLICFRTM